MSRAALALIIAVSLALAVNASWLTPLYELPDEAEHLAVATHWAQGGGMPDLTRSGRGPGSLPPRAALQPPLAAWITALGLHATGLDTVAWLPRRTLDSPDRDLRSPDRDLRGPARDRHGAARDRHGPARYLHGLDEVYPFSPSVRRLHALRLMGLLALVATILGTWQLGLRVTPGRPGVALAAAALVAFQPVVLQRGTALTPGPLALALCTWSLVGIADIASRRHLSGRRALALGALLGAAQIATRSALLLLPVGLVAVLLRRQRGESWALTLRGLDRMVGGYVLVSGPWFAWNLTRYGDLLGSRYMPAGAAAPTWTDGVMAALLRDWTSYAPGLEIGGLALVVWVLVVAGGLTGLLYWQRRRGDIDIRVWLLLMFAWLANLATAAGTVLPASSLHLTVAPLACVLAAGWATWAPRWAGVVGIFALATVAFHSQAAELGPSYWPPERIHDAHFLALDPFESVPDDIELARIETVEWEWPPDRESYLRPPPLRWTPDPDPTARYTVHLVAPDRRLELRSYEDLGLPLRDRWTIPESLWDRLPTGARLYAQVLRLPRAADVATQAPWQGPVEHSEIRILYRIRPEDDL